ncbi:helix-turn-helix domain-containing protein [Paenibacillus sp. IB182496]|uniref:Helix-turn-helix domain-containing protein n=1 Tax=Paenibacillus sabuli TaxID=2772509 RepID=A0A927BWS8_9BACL|nr:helix-turn-helix domain-containing protein [Paenibacillus sabuli]MBD2848292.1 helix-turn-helix domain-containing protein [Paenibacillus sabuli]
MDNQMNNEMNNNVTSELQGQVQSVGQAVATEADWLPRLVAISRVAAIVPDGGWIEALRHFRLLLLEQGSGSFVLNGAHVELSSPALYLLLPGAKLEQGSGGEGSWYQLDFELYLMPGCSGETEDELICRRATQFPCSGRLDVHFGAVLSIMEGLHRLDVDGRQAAARFDTKQRLLRLLELLLARRGVSPAQSEELALQRVATQIAEHYGEELRSEQLAESAGLRPAVFAKRFKAHFGKTPSEFIASLRMNRAKELLLQGKCRNLREVAQRSGFRDEFYFSRRFKQQHRYSPSQYRLEATDELSIISLSFPYTEHLLQLGIVPRAAQVTAELPVELPPLPLPYHASEPWELGRAAFLDCRPDLIVCKNNVEAHARAHIGDLAPVVAFPWSKQDVYELHGQLGRLLGRSERAAEWVAHFRRQGEQARNALPAHVQGATLAIVVRHTRGWRLYGMRNIGHVFYRMLGLRPPRQLEAPLREHAEGSGFTWIEHPAERLLEIEADYILLVGAAGAAQREIRQRLTQPQWRGHPAIATGRFAIADWERWMVYAPLSLQWQLREAVRLLV